MQIDLLRRTLYWARNFSLTTKNIEIDSPSLWRKVNRVIMISILKQIGIKLLRTFGKKSDPLIL